MLEHLEPEVFVRGAENPQLLEDLASKLNGSESARGDDAPIIHRRDRLIERRPGIPPNVFGDGGGGLIPGAEPFDRAADAVIAVANAWYRAGEASREPTSS